ncbi:hypothetical protein EMIHUDRAFT_453607 [Emiliania huxleyi CCMP1516]|uniref:Enhancer of mRNA-decapping protein 4 C-terminal domain-containing protein n=2 Tax=Emiliania huxleyi TaxID=2903 RepID=A0A0D3I3D7_EMIH1|nr:hypothetical protein EMIHUDRAFT_453607 [Emiliania huxleyi CCMP1516]EOD05772.1 hypothetical protein EMIHUDRAFT_453607 [Emiliania huxleyi CCMP1516]|eukprot:XP_005758201.1 hypothetical protein EMIHUDRAFT_453607 [Emiliania huxleyi CCMP1516]
MQDVESRSLSMLRRSPALHTGSLIAANGRFACYAIPSGVIRVIDRQTEALGLLRGHTREAVDLSITAGGGDECLLAAVANDGQALVWRVRAGGSAVQSERLLSVKVDGTSPGADDRIVSAAPLLFTAHGGAVSGLALLEPEGAGEGARLLLTLGEENREAACDPANGPMAVAASTITAYAIGGGAAPAFAPPARFNASAGVLSFSPIVAPGPDAALDLQLLCVMLDGAEALRAQERQALLVAVRESSAAAARGALQELLPLVQAAVDASVRAADTPRGVDSASLAAALEATLPAALSSPMFEQLHAAFTSGTERVSPVATQLAATAEPLASIEARLGQLLADATMELQQLLGRGEHEKAFATALHAQLLELLSWLCSKVDPSELLAARPSQILLTSLVQQLAFDLGASTSMKLKWLLATLPRLDPHDPQIASHVPKILEQVAANLAGCTDVLGNAGHPCHATLLAVSAMVSQLAR